MESLVNGLSIAASVRAARSMPEGRFGATASRRAECVAGTHQLSVVRRSNHNAVFWAALVSARKARARTLATGESRAKSFGRCSG